jgi:hypothetical protein
MSTLGAGNDPADLDPKARRELLLKVYGSALDEYRFNVQLSWDRTKFFLVLSSGLIAAGVGLIKVAQDSTQTSVFLVIFFMLSILINIFGLNTVAVGKDYYREAVFTKTIVERELGLLKSISDLSDPRANLSISVTDGQRDISNILFGRARSSAGQQVFPQTITGYSQAIFWAMMLINGVGAWLHSTQHIKRLIDFSNPSGPRRPLNRHLDDRFHETDHIGSHHRFLVGPHVAATSWWSNLLDIRFEPWKRPTSPW